MRFLIVHLLKLGCKRIQEDNPSGPSFKPLTLHAKELERCLFPHASLVRMKCCDRHRLFGLLIVQIIFGMPYLYPYPALLSVGTRYVRLLANLPWKQVAVTRSEVLKIHPGVFRKILGSIFAQTVCVFCLVHHNKKENIFLVVNVADEIHNWVLICPWWFGDQCEITQTLKIKGKYIKKTRFICPIWFRFFVLCA